MDKTDFRIKEFKSEFIVQKKFTDTYWYSRKIIKSWECVTVYGNRIDWDRYGDMIMLGAFKTLKGARDWVNEIIKEPKKPKYHKI